MQTRLQYIHATRLRLLSKTENAAGHLAIILYEPLVQKQAYLSVCLRLVVRLPHQAHLPSQFLDGIHLDLWSGHRHADGGFTALHMRIGCLVVTQAMIVMTLVAFGGAFAGND